MNSILLRTQIPTNLGKFAWKPSSTARAFSAVKPRPGLALKARASKLKIAFIGGGNCGSAFARRAALNILDKENSGGVSPFNRIINMWVYEEMVGDKKLTDIINSEHTNPRYLPGVQLPTNLIANPNLDDTVIDADVLFFVTPHQFLPSTLEQMRGLVKPNAIAVSLTKGLDVGPEGPRLLSQMIHHELSLVTDVAVLMGANVASEVGNDEYVESTAACRNPDISNLVAEIFHSSCMQIDTCQDVATVEICGAVKNVIAMGGGICDALGLGSSSKGAVLRRGIKEMADFCKLFVGEAFDYESLLASCSLADVIATAYGGRNRRCSQEFAARLLAEESKVEQIFTAPGSRQSRLIYDHLPHYVPVPADAADTDACRLTSGVGRVVSDLHAQEHHEDQQTSMRVSSVDGPVREAYLRNMWAEVEQQLLAGQKLQGLGTLDEVMECLQKLQLLEDSHGNNSGHPQKFGFFKRVHAISRLGESPRTLFDWA